MKSIGFFCDCDSPLFIVSKHRSACKSDDSIKRFLMRMAIIVPCRRLDDRELGCDCFKECFSGRESRPVMRNLQHIRADIELSGNVGLDGLAYV
jgi:hypothetical protein